MTDADSVKSLINEWRETMLNAVANGAGALSDVKDALRALEAAAQSLEASRVYAAQQLEALLRLLNLLELILGSGFYNADLIHAQGLIKKTIKITEDFVNRIQFQIKNLEKLYNILDNLFKHDSLEETGVILREVTEIVEHLAHSL